ncbi:MAG: hypothetical protein K2Y37_18525 [Pirellulales bacterium]|nr:hypothetical protein [Pirellulales bacterium]
MAVSFGAHRLLENAQRDPTILREGLELRDIRRAVEHIEGTYIIRLFAEFETGLRSFLTALRGHPVRIRVEHLIDSVATKRRIPYDLIAGAHAAREYRNTLVHEREEAVEPIAIRTIRSFLCSYFDRLPEDW